MDFLSPSVYHSQLVLWGKSLGCTTVFLSVHTVVLAKQNLPKLTEICTDWAVEVCDVSEKKIICCDREVLLLFACSQLSWGTNCGTLAATQEDPGRCVQVFVVPPPPQQLRDCLLKEAECMIGENVELLQMSWTTETSVLLHPAVVDESELPTV